MFLEKDHPVVMVLSLSLKRIVKVHGNKVGLALTLTLMTSIKLTSHLIVKYLLQEELVVEDIALHTTKTVIKQRD